MVDRFWEQDARVGIQAHGLGKDSRKPTHLGSMQVPGTHYPVHQPTTRIAEWTEREARAMR